MAGSAQGMAGSAQGMTGSAQGMAGSAQGMTGSAQGMTGSAQGMAVEYAAWQSAHQAPQQPSSGQRAILVTHAFGGKQARRACLIWIGSQRALGRCR